MWYAIISEDEPDSLPARLANRSEHLARLQELEQQGRLLLAGPNPAIDSADPGEAGFTGSLIVAEFESLQAAEEWAALDAYKTGGVQRSVQVKPFKKVLPASH